MRHAWRWAAVLGAAAGLSSSRGVSADEGVPAGEPEETLLLQDPTVSATDVVFVHAQDLWVVARAGGVARRLTSGQGTETSPALSPDGSLVAFSGQYEGNTDVYVMPTAGGVPKRLTWHPGNDRVLGWHPDGHRILFASSMESGRPVDRLYLVGLDGGMPEPLPIPSVGQASYAPKSGRLAYTPYPDAFRTWKRYRGGRTTPVWIYDPQTRDVEQVPHVNATDTFPCWAAGDVYFASDRDGHMNLYRYVPGSKEAPERLTDVKDYDVRNVSSGGGIVVYEQAGAIHLYDPATNQHTRLKVKCPTDGLSRQPRWETVKGFVRGAGISPQGQRAVFEARGEIVTVPRENGDARNLTNSPGANDRDPSWSPDGKRIAWFSDQSGEYRLVVRDHLGRAEAKSYDLGGAPFYFDPVWSPDGKHVLFSDKGNRLAFVTLETGKVTKVVDSQGSLGSFQPKGAWSPDSKWIAYERRDPATSYDHLDVFEVATGKAWPVTDAFAWADEPAFSRDGKVLFFRATVDMGRRQFGLDMSAMTSTRPTFSLYAAVLRKDGKNPLAPRSDEGDVVPPPSRSQPRGPGMEGDKGEGKEKEAEGRGEGKDEAAEKPAPPAKPDAGPSIDPEGLDQRVIALPLPPGRYDSLQTTKEALLFIERDEEEGGGGRHRGEEGPAGTLKSFDFDERKAKEVTKGVSSFLVAAGGKHLLVQSGGGWSIASSSGKDEKRLAVDGIQVRVEPEAEWPQTLREVWRLQRDFFYDKNLHGVDWPAMWDRYRVLLPHVHHRADLNVLIGEMMGELCCGHEYVFGGEAPPAPGGVGVGLLGCDVEAKDGRYRIVRIYRGQNWNPGLKAPLTEPGVDTRAGDFVIAVDGKDLTTARNFFAAFENAAGRQVELTLSASADGSNPRKTTVVPVATDADLRRRAWVEANRARVTDLSKGRLAYVYMPDTASAGAAAFDRDFYSQLDKDGLVLDERYNGGGKIADSVIDVLGRDLLCWWGTREGWLGKTPFGTMEGPKVMLVNERAGSGGDALPWMFKKRHLGPLVGTRTWGGLVGISGYPPLMDGGVVTAAAFGILDTDGHWVVENEGVAPDVEVIETPKDFQAGRDAQLEKAVELALGALEKNPPKPRPTVTPPTPR